jgi:mono/diheme cytochrome c family protein
MDASSRPSSRKKRKILIALGVLLVVGALGGWFVWYHLFRELPQPAWITEDPRNEFLYGSIGSEEEAGIPYWLLVTLPRIFPEYLPGPGGYASLGLPWEEGRELPAGFSKKTIGFERVGFNCALCHATRYRTREDETPTVVAAGGSNTADIQGLLDFFGRAAADPRFDSETVLSEIDLAYPLPLVERLLYKAAIPIARRRLLEQAEEFAWAAERPAWGPGRDAPMNLTKFNFLQMERDASVDNTDFPSIWHLAVRKGRPGMKLNLDGATPVARSVLIDSALGLGATNTPFFHRRMAELEDWLSELPAPRWPESLPLDAALAARGETVFGAHCASCHATDPPGERMGTVIPIDEIGTDRERMDTWTAEAARMANEKVASLGIQRDGMEKHEGYVAIPLEGVWLKGPYLHNGAVPTVRDLLEPPAARPGAFYRGNDLLDAGGLGFVSRRCPLAGEEPDAGPGDRSPCAGRVAAPGEPCIPAFVRPDGRVAVPGAWCLDTAERGNGNGGHPFGTELPAEDKDALIEYLKTL